MATAKGIRPAAPFANAMPRNSKSRSPCPFLSSSCNECEYRARTPPTVTVRNDVSQTHLARLGSIHDNEISASSETPTVKPLTYIVEEAAVALGDCKASIYPLIARRILRLLPALRHKRSPVRQIETLGSNKQRKISRRGLRRIAPQLGAPAPEAGRAVAAHRNSMRRSSGDSQQRPTSPRVRGITGTTSSAN